MKYYSIIAAPVLAFLVSCTTILQSEKNTDHLGELSITAAIVGGTHRENLDCGICGDGVAVLNLSNSAGSVTIRKSITYPSSPSDNTTTELSKYLQANQRKYLGCDGRTVVDKPGGRCNQKIGYTIP